MFPTCATFTRPELGALERRWVRLEVGPFAYSVTEMTFDEAEAWWDAQTAVLAGKLADLPKDLIEAAQ